MQFAFTPEQAMIREAAQSYAAQYGDSHQVRRAVETEDGFDRAAWQVLVGELGFGGIATPESAGGSGLGMVELASVHEMLGRSLMPSPYLASIGVAATLLNALDSDAARALLPAVIGGDQIATLAYCGKNGGADVSAVPMTLSADGVLDGEAWFVQFGHVADIILCAARDTGDNLHVAFVRRDTPGLEVERLPMMDQTRPMARVKCTGVRLAPADIVGGAGDALIHALRTGALLVASEAVGGAGAALEATVAYTKERHQFGRAIGSFQALKHRMADMMVAIEAAKGIAWYAAAAAGETPEDFAEAASVAKTACTEAMMKVAGDMIQLHGGIGFTWEHDAHLFFKRARSSLTLFGTPDWHREIIMNAIEQGAVA